MLGRRTSAVSVFIALPTLVLASCHLVGGTTDLEIDPTFYEQNAGGDSTSTGGGGEATTTSTTTSSSSTGGSGGSPPTCDPTACPGTDCLEGICDADGMCDVDEMPTHTVCDDDGGSYCDGLGNCVECTLTEHCTGMDPNALCLDNACYQPGCNNGGYDAATETDVDCGNECPGCDNGRNCIGDSDCKSNLCDANTCEECNGVRPCAADHYCDNPFGGDCRPKQGNGSFCLSDAVCLSGCCAVVCSPASSCS